MDFLTRAQILARKAGFILMRMPETVWATDIHRARKGNTYLQPLEAWNILEFCRNTVHICGDVAEVGVCGGESAMVMLGELGRRKLHLFDTFTGLPEPEECDVRSGFETGQYKSNIEEVVRYLGEFPIYHIGNFAESRKDLDDRAMFSFVHLDADLHEVTLDALEFFWERLSFGGMIVGHDYHDGPKVSGKIGVKMAWDKFSIKHNVPVIPLPNTSQILAAK